MWRWLGERLTSGERLQWPLSSSFQSAAAGVRTRCACDCNFLDAGLTKCVCNAVRDGLQAEVLALFSPKSRMQTAVIAGTVLKHWSLTPQDLLLRFQICIPVLARARRRTDMAGFRQHASRYKLDQSLHNATELTRHIRSSWFRIALHA